MTNKRYITPPPPNYDRLTVTLHKTAKGGDV